MLASLQAVRAPRLEVLRSLTVVPHPRLKVTLNKIWKILLELRHQPSQVLEQDHLEPQVQNEVEPE